MTRHKLPEFKEVTETSTKTLIEWICPTCDRKQSAFFRPMVYRETLCYGCKQLYDETINKEDFIDMAEKEGIMGARIIGGSINIDDLITLIIVQADDGMKYEIEFDYGDDSEYAPADNHISAIGRE